MTLRKTGSGHDGKPDLIEGFQQPLRGGLSRSALGDCPQRVLRPPDATQPVPDEPRPPRPSWRGSTAHHENQSVRSCIPGISAGFQRSRP